MSKHFIDMRSAQTGESKMGRMCYQYEDKAVVGLLATHPPTVGWAIMVMDLLCRKEYLGW